MHYSDFIQGNVILTLLRRFAKLTHRSHALFRLRYIFIADDVCPLLQLTSNDLMAL